jgi:MHS family proline/betaine transporter-like MFS transporter
VSASVTAGDRPALGRRIAVAAGFGNFMEWFDFAVYGFFATTIGKVFFPSSSPTGSLLSALAVFGIAFFMRPLGGIVLGAVGDRVGRRAALATSVVLMGASTTLVAALPSYATAGVLAPVLLVALRCLQGLSAGGEWAGSASFLVEYAPTRRRALWGSVVTATAALGSLGGALVAIALTAWLTPAQMEAWGWRIPFVLAAPLAIAGLYVRLRLEDTPVYRRLQRRHEVSRTPLREALTRDLRPIALVFFCAAVEGLGYYYLATYVINYLTSDGVGMATSAALAATAGGLAVYAALCPLAGVLSDRIGRRPCMVLGSAGLALVAIPVFLLMGTGTVAAVVLGIAVFAVFEAMVNVTTVVLLVELFPARTRMSGGSIGFNLALAAIGGPGPLIAAALASAVDVPGAGAFYMVAVALVALVALAALLPETRGVAIGTRGEDERFTREARPASAAARRERAAAGGL